MAKTDTNTVTLAIDVDVLGASIAKALGGPDALAKILAKASKTTKPPKAEAEAEDDGEDDGLDDTAEDDGEDDAETEVEEDEEDDADNEVEEDEADEETDEDEEDTAAAAAAAKKAKAAAAAKKAAAATKTTGTAGPSRADVQAALRSYAAKTDKAKAMKLIKTIGKAEGLSSLKPNMFQAVIDKAKALTKAAGK